MHYVWLKDVLTAMEGDEEFSMQFVTYDKQRKTAGEIVEVEKAKGMWKEAAEVTGKGVKTSNPEEQLERRKKQPNHWENATRNIVIGSQIRKVHIRLITKFNGKPVIW